MQPGREFAFVLQNVKEWGEGLTMLLLKLNFLFSLSSIIRAPSFEEFDKIDCNALIFL
jgi:hypothetical protein